MPHPGGDGRSSDALMAAKVAATARSPPCGVQAIGNGAAGTDAKRHAISQQQLCHIERRAADERAFLIY